jgi:hypothetical protein
MTLPIWGFCKIFVITLLTTEQTSLILSGVQEADGPWAGGKEARRLFILLSAS